jgi:hypothetical protein
MVGPPIEGTSRRLTKLLIVDLRNSFLQWQAQLLSNYKCVPHGVEVSTLPLWQVVLDSSLANYPCRQSLPIVYEDPQLSDGELELISEATLYPHHALTQPSLNQ